MSHKTSLAKSASLVAAFIWMMATKPAHAYLDPGTGSYLFQIGLASLFGVVFAIKTFWLQIKAFFAKLMGKKVEPTPAPKNQEKDNG